MPSYSYELHSDGELVSTGHFTTEAALRVGDEVHVGSALARVDAILPSDASGEERLVLRAGYS